MQVKLAGQGKNVINELCERRINIVQDENSWSSIDCDTRQITGR